MAAGTTKQAAAPIEVHKGLGGVIVDRTAVSKVNPATNSLLYRGYPVDQLTARTSEEVAYLLWHGELPTTQQLSEFTGAERARRALDDRTREVIDAVPAGAHPMDVLRTAVSAIGAADLAVDGGSAEGPDPAATPAVTPAVTPAADADAVLDRALTLYAKLPAIIAYDQRRRRGLAPVPPRADLGRSANFLWMVFESEPDDAVRRAFDTSMILYAEHGFNASTFTARVIASTLADFYSAVVGAIGALKGPLHGGANEAVMRAFGEIGTPDRVPQWLGAALAAKRKVMGFGHRVYKNGDSRVPTMQAELERLSAHLDRPDLLALYTALADAMRQRTGIKPNLDYPAGPVYHLIGFDTGEFTPLFVAARIVGWSAHIVEQRADNALIRPLSQYVGPDERPVGR